MNDYSQKFRSPLWKEKEAQIIEAADHQCAECDAYEDLEVHICYFESGKEPWEYPDEAYKCYCREHRAGRRSVELDVRKALAAFSSNELDSLHQALRHLAQVPDGSRPQAVEYVYVEAKRQRFDRAPEDSGFVRFGDSLDNEPLH